MTSLPPEKNPYAARSPFEVLGVSRNATAVEIRDAHEEKMEEVNDAGYPDKERLARLKELKEAYNALSDFKNRVSVEIFFFDNSAGRQECRTMAEKHKTVVFDFDQVLHRVEDIVPTKPDVEGAKRKFKPVTFEHSVRLKTEGHRFALDPEQEALNGITFER